MSYDWRFGNYEYLAIIVSLVCVDEVYGNEKTFDDLLEEYNDQTAEEIYEIIQTKPKAQELFDAALEAVRKKKVKCFSKKSKINASPALAQIEPLSFIAWAQERETPVPYFLRKAANEAGEEAYIESYDKRQLDKDDFHSLMREPLWDLNTATLYLHGFQSCNPGAKGYRSETMDSTCVRKVPDLKKIRQYALDASAIHALELYGRDDKKVKPAEFIAWSKTLHMDFACYQWLPQTSEEKKKTPKPDHVTPDMQLMFDAIEKFWAGYDLSRPNPSIAPVKREVVDWLVQEARRRKIDFSKTRAEHIDTIMRCPESRKGGNTF